MSVFWDLWPLLSLKVKGRLKLIMASSGYMLSICLLVFITVVIEALDNWDICSYDTWWGFILSLWRDSSFSSFLGTNSSRLIYSFKATPPAYSFAWAGSPSEATGDVFVFLALAFCFFLFALLPIGKGKSALLFYIYS